MEFFNRIGRLQSYKLLKFTSNQRLLSGGKRSINNRGMGAHAPVWDWIILVYPRLQFCRFQMFVLKKVKIAKGLAWPGCVREETIGATQGYRHSDGRRIVIHVHPKKTYGPGLLKDLLGDIGWSEKEMRKLKLIK